MRSTNRPARPWGGVLSTAEDAVTATDGPGTSPGSTASPRARVASNSIAAAPGSNRRCGYSVRITNRTIPTASATPAAITVTVTSNVNGVMSCSRAEVGNAHPR
jgi:hypothetical protein